LKALKKNKDERQQDAGVFAKELEMAIVNKDKTSFEDEETVFYDQDPANTDTSLQPKAKSSGDDVMFNDVADGSPALAAAAAPPWAGGRRRAPPPAAARARTPAVGPPSPATTRGAPAPAAAVGATPAAGPAAAAAAAGALKPAGTATARTSSGAHAVLRNQDK